MIVAGLDEAGYGPLLGPLVVGCCAFELTDCDSLEELPCLWRRLSKIVSKKRSLSGKRLHINDSKVVYSPAHGLKELERSVLAMMCARETEPGDVAGLLGIAADHVLGDLGDYPWYQPIDGEQFPLEQAMLPIRLMGNGLRSQMGASGTRCTYLAARIVLERQLNRQISQTRNKATVLFSTTAIHLDHLLQTFGHLPMTIFCDRQGGREHYGSLLRLMFDSWELKIVEEVDGRCEYRLHRRGNQVRILFREKAEAQCLPVAMASMLSKYLRETLMRRFNAFWLGHLPQVEPTAGYYNDGSRFLRDIDTKRREMGIRDEELVRCR